MSEGLMMGSKSAFAFLIIGLLFPSTCLPAESASSEIPKPAARNAYSKSSLKRMCPTDPRWANICKFFNKYQTKDKCQKLTRTTVEQQLGKVCVEKECKASDISLDELYRMGISKDDTDLKDLISESERWPLSASLVDIDNDATKELRLRRTVGSARCVHSDFWKKDTSGHLSFVKAKGYDRLAEEGSGCGSHYEFIRYSGTIYTLCVNYDPPEHIPWIDTVWKGSATELTEICTDRDCN
jgi:hypothetical protein